MTYCALCARETTHVLFWEGGKDWEYGVPGTFRQERCEECGLVSTVPMPSLEEIRGYYSAEYHGYQAPTSALTQWLIHRNLRQRAKMYQRLIGRSGMILDVGAADGAHFDVWKKEGDWILVGFEFHEDVAAEARTKGREISTATMETFDAKGRQFDLIIMNHLLEHVQDPRDTVARAAALLKPGGYIVGEVPNLRSWDCALMGVHWGGCHWPRHIQQFTPDTLTRLFGSTGFHAPQFSYPLHTSHWALSIQNWLQDHAFTRVTLKNGRAWYYPFLLLAFIPLNLIQKLLGRTGIVGFTAQKPRV